MKLETLQAYACGIVSDTSSGVEIRPKSRRPSGRRRIKLAYFGTPYFSADFLEKILTDPDISKLIEVKLVVTQPDKPVGRKQVLTSSPVKVVAQNFQLSIFNFQSNSNNLNFKNLNIENSLKIKSVDLTLLYAFGQIIPKDLLTIPKYGFINIHPSLLPKYRGPSPIAYPLILGDKKTGVTIIKMDEEIDHGPIIAQQELVILPTDRRPDLEKKLTKLAFEMFKKIVSEDTKFFATETKNFGIKRLKGQNHSLATYTRLLKKSDGFIPFSTLQKTLNNQPLTYEELPTIIKEYLEKYPKEKKEFSKKTFNLFRGLYPWPGIWTLIDIQKASEPPRFYKKKPSDNLGGLMKKRLKITGVDFVNGKLIIKKVQLEGKKEVDFETFNKAYQIF